jgi:hypothetical protein
MSGLRRMLGATLVVIAAVGVFSATATGTHNNRINDGTDPNATVGPNGNNCSADAVTPAGNYAIVWGDWAYRLRYSANCRSVWGRSSNQAPKRNDMVTHRHSPERCVSGIRNGDTYTWTNQVDDAGHLSNVHLNTSGYNGCAASGALDSTALY